MKKIITALQATVLAMGLAFALAGCSKDEDSTPMEKMPPPNPDNPDIPPEPGTK